MSVPRVAVIVVSYGHARWLPPLFAALDRVTYPRDRWTLWLLDNASEDDTLAVMRGALDASETRTAGGVDARLVANPTNAGFAGGNDLCIRQAMAEGYDFVYLLNPDTVPAPDFLERAVEAAADPTVGAVQSLLLLGQEPELVNSVGNAFHYLGFSYCLGYRDRADSPAYAAMRGSFPEIVCASGAGVLLRVSALAAVGLLDRTLFAYHEDADLSLRMRLAGFRVVLAPRSVVRHFYEFSRSITKYYWMERNRWIVLWKTLRVRTILLTAPMHCAMELGLLLFSFKGGWTREWVRARAWFLWPKNLAALARGRREVQRSRRIPDRELVRRFTTEIGYQEVDSFLLRRVGNPLMTRYWRLVRPLIRW